MNRTLHFIVTTAAAIFFTTEAQVTTPPRTDGAAAELRATAGAPTRLQTSRTTTPEGYSTYRLHAKSMFDENDENAFAWGGEPKEFNVDVRLDASSGSFIGLIGPYAGCEQPIDGTYDKNSGTITISAPLGSDGNHDVTKAPVIGEAEGMKFILVAVNPYGIGYMHNVDNIVMDVSSDQKRIKPRSAIGMLMQDAQSEYVYGYYEVLFDICMFKECEGIAVTTDVDNLDFGTGYIGHTYTKDFTLYNIGTEEADYVLNVSGEGYSVDSSLLSGTLPAGGSKLIQISFTASSVGTHPGIVTFETEEGEVSMDMTQITEGQTDYSTIVREGDIAFGMPDAYPFEIRMIDGTPMAVNSNSGLFSTSSQLVCRVNVPEKNSGKFSWKGIYDPHWSSYDHFRVYLDGNVLTDMRAGALLDETIELSAGSHEIIFSYDKGTEVLTDPSVYGNDFVRISELGFVCNPVSAFSLSLSDSEIDFGRYFKGSRYAYSNDPVKEEQRKVTVTNSGYSDVTITGADENPHFYINAENKTLAPGQTCAITVGAKTDEIGQFDENLVLHTNLGDATVRCKSAVETMPDFSAIVEQGDFSFDTNRHNPFVTEGSAAFNSSTGIPDEKSTISYLVAYFTVPEGKVGSLSWDALVDTEYFGSGLNSDYGAVYVDDFMKFGYGQSTIQPETFNPSDVVSLAPGEHRVIFWYNQCGDGKAYFTDRMTVSGLSLTVEDKLPDDKVVLWEDSDILDFGEIYADRSASISINLANLGSSAAKITNITVSEPFKVKYNADTEYESLNKIPLTVTFNPEFIDGEFEMPMTIATTGGDIVLTLKGIAKSVEEFLLREDFENGAEGWTFFDKDDDSDRQWDLYEKEDYAVSANHSLRSISSSYTGVMPDNYAVSPEFIVPDEGATLTYWVRAYDEDKCHETYDVIIGNEDDLSTYKVILSDQTESAVYVEKKLDLKEFAGQIISVIFRHHSEKAMSSILLDDVFVRENEESGVDSVLSGAEIISVEYYDLSGMRVANPTQGIYIRKAICADGRKSVDKIVK